MRKFFSYSLLLATALFVSSCDNNDDWDLPRGYAFATVMEDAEDDVTYFMLDNDETFIVEQNKSNVDIDKLEDGQRVVAGVTLYEDDSAIYDYTADLYVIYRVIMGENVVVNNEAEADEIPDDRLAYVVDNMTLTRGYLNILAGFKTDDMDSVNFRLVENLVVDEDEKRDSDYLYLELRYDNGDSDSAAAGYESYVSFDMDAYREQLEDKEGIKLRIKTVKSGTITLTIKSFNLYPEVKD